MYFILLTNIFLLMGNINAASYSLVSLKQLLLVGLDSSQGLRIKTGSPLGGALLSPRWSGSLYRPLELCLHL